MTEFKSQYLHPAAVASIAMLAYMFFPRDDKRREQFKLVRMIAQGSFSPDDIGETVVPYSVAQELALAPSLEEFGLLTSKMTEKASIAGEIFLNYIEMASSPGFAPSIVKAKYVAADYFKFRATKADGTRGVSSNGEIGKAWMLFNNVAHLWAAYNLLINHEGREGVLKVIMEEPHRLLTIANCLLEMFLDAQDTVGIMFGCETFAREDFLRIPSEFLLEGSVSFLGMEEETKSLLNSYVNLTAKNRYN